MDLNDYWQENKRFLTTVFAGIVLFLIGQVLIGNTLSSKLGAAQARINAARRTLSGEMYSPRQLASLSAENERLEAAVATLRDAVAFEPRPEFRLRDGAGRSTNQFFAIVTETRDELLRMTGREGVRIPDDLGLPGLSPTHDDEIVRTLEALDVIDRVVRLAVRADVLRVDELQIKLDPSLGSRGGVAAVERTRIKAKLSGPASGLLRFLSATQDPAPFGSALIVEEFLLQPARRKADEGTLEVTFNVVRFHADVEVEG